MKKTIAENDRTNTPGYKYLIEGANLLITEIKKPSVLLDFMFESFWWLDQLDKEYNIESDHFLERQFYQLVLQPWFAGGKDVACNIAAGLEAVRDAVGSEGYEKYLSRLIQGFGINCKEGIYTDSDQYLNVISTLLKLSFFIQQYEGNKLYKAA
jgi:hypothetical protein